MKNLVVLIIVSTLFLIGCTSQNKAKEIVTVQKDTIKPKTKITVHKEYDNDGNLISIDSTYYYFYSTIKNDTLLEKEIFDKFKNNFNDYFTSFDSILMGNLFDKSSFKINNFYTDDYFQKQFKLHQKRFDDVIKEMDSLKNSFYKNNEILFDE